MFRNAYSKLVSWKNRASRKPLIIQGARQVGKTWLMRELGKNEFRQTAYFNFESTQELRAVFSQGLDTQKIIRGLEIIHGQTINFSGTLIIFDEIQSCPEAVTSLKYFQEDRPEIFIIAAGSLLGVAMHSSVSFPVGKVEFLDLEPMGFSEFLRAIGQTSLLEAIESSPSWASDTFASRLIETLKEFLFVGGMPEVVKDFVQNRDFSKVRLLQNNIIRAYENDFSKHAPANQVARIRMVWQAIPGQLAKENSKFIYSVLRTGARAKEFEVALEWLRNAGLIHKVYRITKPGLPLSMYANWTDFKVYLNDTGLMCAMSGLTSEVLLNGNQLFTEFKGTLSEQFVIQMLRIHGMNGYYWNPENARAEVDFVIQQGNNVIPVEVKSSDNIRSKSLRVYHEKYQPSICIRTSLAGFKQQDWMMNIPLYGFEQWLTGFEANP